MPGQNTSSVDLAQLRQVLFTGVVADVLDTLGYRNQSPRVQLRPLTGVPTFSADARRRSGRTSFTTIPIPTIWSWRQSMPVSRATY